MTTEKEITCIVCPMGCKILVNTKEKQFKITRGNKCKKGMEYAKNEVCDPRRTVTTSILVKDGEWPLVSVRSTQPIPKDKMFTALQEIRHTMVNAPVTSGQVLIRNIALSGIDIVATKTVQKK